MAARARPIYEASGSVKQLANNLNERVPQTLSTLEKVGSVAIGAMVAITTIAAIALIFYIKNGSNGESSSN